MNNALKQLKIVSAAAKIASLLDIISKAASVMLVIITVSSAAGAIIDVKKTLAE